MDTCINQLKMQSRRLHNAEKHGIALSKQEDTGKWVIQNSSHNHIST